MGDFFNGYHSISMAERVYRAIVVREFGGPANMIVEELPLTMPGVGQVFPHITQCERASLNMIMPTTFLSQDSSEDRSGRRKSSRNVHPSWHIRQVTESSLHSWKGNSNVKRHPEKLISGEAASTLTASQHRSYLSPYSKPCDAKDEPMFADLIKY
jgi:hypothetical protein